MENNIDYKLGQISSDIASLKLAHDDDKKVRDDNHNQITDIAKTQGVMKQTLDDSILRWDSWKDGQTIYMHKTTEDILKLDKTIERFKDDFEPRLKKVEGFIDDSNANRKDNNARIRDNTYSLAKWLIAGLIGAILVNIQPIIATFINIIGK